MCSALQSEQTTPSSYYTASSDSSLRSKMNVHVLGVLFLGFLASPVSTYSNGRVHRACDTMTPLHGTTVPQTTEPPYFVFASSYTYSPGDEITVTLQANPAVLFDGFLLQARSSPGNEIVGHFIVIDPYSQNLTCAENADSTVVQKSSAKKSNVTALWVAPASVSGVIFKATFLQSKNTFWVGVESPVLAVSSNSNTTSSPIVSSTASNAISSPKPTISTPKPTISTPKPTSSTPKPTSSTPKPTSSTASTHVSSSRPPSSLISSETCGTQKVCLSNPSDCDPSKSSNCVFMSSAKTDAGAYHYEISGPSGGYVSFGFSDDQIMGEDDIYICVINSNGQVEIQHAYSEGRTLPEILTLSNVDVGMASFSGGVIQCSFTSRNPISTQPPIRRAQSSNSSDMYYILMAYGAAENGRIRFHESGVFSSDTKVNLSVASNVTHSQPRDLIMVKAHGALMLIAWMTTGTLGMIMARYLKMAAKRPVLGKALWFQAHMVFMVLTVVSTIVAFVLSFVAAKGWAYHVSTHAIIGCIVMILAFFQPLVAFFRPSPESSRRFFFNSFHGVNAVLMKVLAVANLFLGFQYIDHTLGWMVNVMAGFVAWEALAIISLEINSDLARKEMQKLGDKESSGSSVKAEVYLLLIYLCGNLAFLIALLVGIGIA